MRYIISFILFFVSAPAFSAPSPAPEFDPCHPAGYRPIAKTYLRGLFFKISKCGVQDSYILGTMHSDLPQVRNAIPKSVWTILAQAKSANFELKEDEPMQKALMEAMFFSADSGKTLRSEIGDELYAKLTQTLAARHDLTEQVYAKMRPWAVGILMQVPADANDGVHLDTRLEKFATDKAVPVYGLETVTEQLAIFTALSQAEQLEFLREAIDNYAITDSMNDKMLSRYLQRNLNGLQSLADASFALMKDAALKAKLEKTLITERNLRMVERMQPRLNEGNAFIALGALHLPTEKGLLTLLERKGYYIHVVNK